MHKKYLGLGIILVTIVLTLLMIFYFDSKSLNDSKEEVSSGDSDKEENVQGEEEVYEDILEVPSELQPYLDQISDDLIMTTDEIATYNSEIASKTTALYDVLNMTTISKKQIEDYINSYETPSLPKYNGNRKVTSQEVTEMLENRNLSAVEEKDTIVRGLIVQRSNLRSFPTNVHFYDSPSSKHLDRLQETELFVNTPVIVLHTSKDAEWYFVLSPIYYGWVESKTVALATKEDWDFFLNDDKFVVVTEKNIDLKGNTLDMSVKLPYISVDKDFYQVSVPSRDTDGKVIRENIQLKHNQVYRGYVPYTRRNLYIQALKYKDVPYQWGGYTGGVDCSSFVLTVFRTFGFQFPRNTSTQNSSVGQIIDVSDKSTSDKMQLIAKYPGSLLYQSGHVMLYLGEYEEKHYIIHANGSTINVAITPLDGSSYLNKINKIVLINSTI